MIYDPSLTERQQRIWKLLEKKDKKSLTISEQKELDDLAYEDLEANSYGYRDQNLSIFI